MLIRRRQHLSQLELIAVSLVLGPMLSVILDQLLVGLGLKQGRLYAVFALAVAGVLVLWFQQRTKVAVRAVDRKTLWDAIAICLSTLAAALYLFPFWRSFPLEWKSWGSIGTDSAFNEAVANSLADAGPSANYMVDGYGMSYHWYSHAWAGLLAAVAEAQPFLTITRVLPLVSISTALLLVFVLVKKWSGQVLPAIAACVLLLLQGSVSTASVFTPLSPQQCFVLVEVLVIAWCFWLSQRDELRFPMAVMPILVLVSVLTKANAVVVVGGLVAAALASWMSQAQSRRGFFLAALSLGAALLGIAMEAQEQGRNGLSFSLTQTANYLRLGFPDLHGGTVLTLLLVLALLSAPALGLILPLSDNGVRWDSRIWFALGTGSSAVLLAAFLGQSGQSQFSFVVTGSIVVVPTAVWGIFSRWQTLGTGPKALISIATVLVAAGAVAWYAPSGLLVALFLLSSLAVFVPAMLFSRRYAWLRRLAFLAAIFSLVASTGVSARSALVALSGPARSELDWQASPTNSMSMEQRAALMWLRANVPNDAVIATNRYCDAIELTPPDCLSMQFDISSLGRHQALIEGYTYSAGEGRLPEWALGRLRASLEFVNRPSESSRDELLRWGATWVYIDKRMPHSPSWDPWGETRFENEGAAVVELSRPAK